MGRQSALEPLMVLAAINSVWIWRRWDRGGTELPPIGQTPIDVAHDSDIQRRLHRSPGLPHVC